ncbi:MAG TPA: GTP-binding protein, partial [Stellaceae bacterium]|nr:GTP-binding protein [Stellaceae bacterium]
MGERAGGPRVAALVGPYLSGKTTLLEALLFAAEAIHRRGTQRDQTTVGDSAPEARARQMSTEINPAHATYLGDRWFFLDCPGSVELATEAQTALFAADVAVVVCEAVPDRVLALSPLLKFLDDRQIPHMIFVNKVDQTSARVSEVLAALQSISA